MKIQCPCGQKFVFEAQPEMLAQPGRFICAGCGKDWSDFINSLIRQELTGNGQSAPAAAPAVAVAPAPEIAPPPPGIAVAPVAVAAPAPIPVPAPSPVTAAPAARISIPAKPATPVPPAPAPVAPHAGPVRVAVPVPVPAPAPQSLVPQPPAPTASGLRINSAPKAAEEPAAADTGPRMCSKHPNQLATEHCAVCRRPICPQCMELFGYLCSPLCRQKAELQGIDVPEFAGQRAVADRQQWRKVGLSSLGITAGVLLLVGVWIWYTWVGSRPRPAYSFRFSEPSFSGKSVIVNENQIVFLHGGTLARHDFKTKKEIWSRQLIDKQAVDVEVERTIKGLRAEQDRLNTYHPDADPIKIPSPADLAQEVTKSMEAGLELRVVGQSIWVGTDNKLTKYEWDTGKPGQELVLESEEGHLLTQGDELVMLGRNEKGGRAVVHLNLATGQKRLEDMNDPVKPAPTAVAANTKAGPAGKSGSPASARAQAQIIAASTGKKLDPAKVAEQAQNLPGPAKIALPATLGVARNQEKALAELRGESDRPGPPAGAHLTIPEEFNLVPCEGGFAEFSVTLLEEKVEARAAMKAKPKKSALEGTVNQAATVEIANEILNDMRRDGGDDVETEDVSRYAVAVRLPCAQNADAWRAEVIGHPVLIPQKTVNVVAAGKTVIVLDKSNKKKWEATLSHQVSGGGGGDDFDEEEGEMSYGAGPCVERGDTLYVIDQGVLTAFDLATGNAKWRLPSVGIAGIFFDDKGMIYANTTSASPDKLKYSKQIDISDRTVSVVMKLDPKSGKTLWSTEPGGMIRHLSGKYIYTFASNQSYDSDTSTLSLSSMGLNNESYMRIKRINPRNGKVMWAHFEPRAPLDIHFDKNTINCVFRKEVEVLKFLSF